MLRSIGLPPGECVRSDGTASWPDSWTPEQRAAAQSALLAFDDSPAAQAAWQRSQSLEAATVIVETIDDTDDPVLLAIRELVLVLMEEIQGIKGGKPKESKTWDAHKKATAERLRAKKA